MNKQFKVSLWEEIGGFAFVIASTLEEAKIKVQQQLDDEGVAGFTDFDTTHRDVNILDIEEKKGE